MSISKIELLLNRSISENWKWVIYRNALNPFGPSNVFFAKEFHGARSAALKCIFAYNRVTFEIFLCYTGKFWKFFQNRGEGKIAPGFEQKRSSLNFLYQIIVRISIFQFLIRNQRFFEFFLIHQNHFFWFFGKKYCQKENNF